MIEKIEIADIVIELNKADSFIINDSFLPFLTDEDPHYVIEFKEKEELHIETGEKMYAGDCYDVYQGKSEGRQLLFYDLNNKTSPYAVGNYNWNKKKAMINYIPHARNRFSETGNSFFHISWESLLLKESRMILHSSCIDTEVGGILFSGPSGIGKSTQADLWCRYEKAELINGDRTILHYKDDKWYGYGSPYAGSSRVYRNKNTAIRAIVMLSQSKVCRIKRLDMGEAFRKIYAQLTVNDWDKSYVNKILDLTQRLVQEVPVYHLQCTPAQEAVELLKSEIMKEEVLWN